MRFITQYVEIEIYTLVMYYEICGMAMIVNETL